MLTAISPHILVQTMPSKDGWQLATDVSEVAKSGRKLYIRAIRAETQLFDTYDNLTGACYRQL